MNSDRAEMNDIIEYLNAWVDEDERTAKAAMEDVGGLWYIDSEGEVRAAGDANGYVVIGAWEGGTGAAGELIVRHGPERTLAEVAVIRQVINYYRVSDGAILRGDPDFDDPGWRGIYAGRDAFKSVLRAYAKAAGWEPTITG